MPVVEVSQEAFAIMERLKKIADKGPEIPLQEYSDMARDLGFALGDMRDLTSDGR